MSEKRTRVRRPTPARTTPIRDFSTVLQDEPPASDKPDSSQGADGERPKSDLLSDVVAQGARLGYTVIQEQIRQGQLIAQQWTQAKRPGNGFDVNQLLQRMMHLSTDLGALLLDITNVITRTGADNGGRTGAAVASSGAGTQGTSAHVSVEVEARGHAKVMLDLAANAVGASLHAPALYSLDGASPPLTLIVFEGLSLHVKIPDEQPAGTYSGVVVDRRTNEPKGTLSVQLSR